MTSKLEKQPFPTSDVKTYVYIDPKNLKNADIMNVKKELERNSEVELYPSAYHAFSNSEYKKVSNNLVKTLQSPGTEWCDGVNLDYISYTFNESNLLIIVKHKTTVLGFSAINIYGDRMNLEIICTNNAYKGVGTFMDTLLNDIAVDAGIESIGLEAVTTAVGFYLKTGYNCVDDLCPMEKVIEARIRPKTERVKPTKSSVTLVKRTRGTTVAKPSTKRARGPTVAKPVEKPSTKRTRVTPSKPAKGSIIQTRSKTMKAREPMKSKPIEITYL